MRRFMVALTLLFVAAPALANVSLGAIDVRSFLNQPLDAQIRIEGSSVADESLEIRLAPEADYRRLGLSRVAVPPDLVMRVEGTGTSRLLRLSTERPVREPYVGLLLEARWSSGRTLREYSLLLDPPVAFAPARSAPPQITEAPASRVAPAPAPAVAATQPSRPEGSYRVNRGDTLFSIVQRAGYSGVTDEQVMLAILAANPDAFIGRNINQLRADVTLNLPAADDVVALSSPAARQEVRRQTEAWRARAAPPQPPPAAVAASPAPPVPPAPPEAIATDPPTETAAAPESRPEAAPPAEPAPLAEAEAAPAAPDATVEASEGTEIPSEDRLEILAEQAAQADEPAAPASALILEEALLSQQVAMSEMRDELAGLRAELEERDRALAVVSTEMAQLESRMRALQTGTSGDGPSFAGMPLQQRILADPLLLLMSGIMLLLFLLLLLALFRRPRARMVSDTLPRTTGPQGTDHGGRDRTQPGAAQQTGRNARFGGAAAGGAAAAAAAAKAASARRQEEGAVDEPVAVAEGVGEDVLADVDLYLAYGMNEQAITALQHAISDGHDSVAYRVRLLEAHGANDDADAVRQQAAALRADLDPEQSEWLERVAAVERLVGGDLASGGAKPGPGADRGSGVVPDTEASGGSEPDTGRSADSETDSGTMEFDGSGFEAAGAPDQAPGKTATDDGSESGLNLLNFNLDDLESTATPREDKGSQPAQQEELGDLPPLSFLDSQSASGEGHAAASASSEEERPDTSEIGMKLSLAEAFAEMGDRDGAVALLEEITSDATEAQLAKAAEIRRQLDRA